jgi:hypothetical protein
MPTDIAADTQQSYSHIPRPFGRQVTLRLTPSALVVDDSRKETSIPYREITSLRLSYEMRNTMSAGYRCRMTFAKNRTLSFSNISWRALVETEAKNGPYRAFVQALVPRIVTANPQARLYGGKPNLIWLLIILLGGMAVLAMGYITWRAFELENWPLVTLVGGVGMVLAWQQNQLVIRNKPQVIDPHLLPDQLLPPPDDPTAPPKTYRT